MTIFITPDKYDNKGELKGISAELRQKKIDGRIKSLEKQVRKNQGELNKAEKKLQQKREELENVIKQIQNPCYSKLVVSQ